jgi:hypothetical protein
MKLETVHFDWSEGDHHYTILSEFEMKELLNRGIVCVSFNPDGSFSYIVTEEEWRNFNVKGGERHV